MSESSVGDQDNKASGDVDELSALKKSKDLILSEKKKLANELNEYKAKFEAGEQEKMEAQGKLKELNDSLKKQIADKDNQFKSAVKQFGGRVLKSSFEQEAKAAGCVDSDALYKLVDLSTIDISEDFSFDSEQLKTAISDAQKARSYLFKKEAVATKDGNPAFKKDSGSMDVSKLGGEDLKKLLTMKLLKT